MNINKIMKKAELNNYNFDPPLLSRYRKAVK